MPVSPQMTRPAPATMPASCRRSVRPASTRVGGRPAAQATRWASGRSAALPVITTGASARSSAAATVANRSAGQHLAPNAAPGCTITAGPLPRAPGGTGSRRSAGSAGMPNASSSAHQRARSCGCRAAISAQSGPAQPGLRNPIRSAGRVRSSAWWLCGPEPCRFTASAGGRTRFQRSASGRSVGSTSSTAPPARASSPSAAGAASTSGHSGWWRRSARSAGTTTSRSPRPDARSARIRRALVRRAHLPAVPGPRSANRSPAAASGSGQHTTARRVRPGGRLAGGGRAGWARPPRVSRRRGCRPRPAGCAARRPASRPRPSRGPR